VRRIDLVLLRGLRVAVLHAVLLVFPLLVLPKSSLNLHLFLLPTPGIPEDVLLQRQRNI
jgi:hypothetical protein